jgi:hypothetical protein
MSESKNSTALEQIEATWRILYYQMGSNIAAEVQAELGMPQNLVGDLLFEITKHWMEIMSAATPQTFTNTPDEQKKLSANFCSIIKQIVRQEAEKLIANQVVSDQILAIISEYHDDLVQAIKILSQNIDNPHWDPVQAFENMYALPDEEEIDPAPDSTMGEEEEESANDNFFDVYEIDPPNFFGKLTEKIGVPRWKNIKFLVDPRLTEPFHIDNPLEQSHTFFLPQRKLQEDTIYEVIDRLALDLAQALLAEDRSIFLGNTIISVKDLQGNPITPEFDPHGTETETEVQNRIEISQDIMSIFNFMTKHREIWAYDLLLSTLPVLFMNNLELTINNLLVTLEKSTQVEIQNKDLIIQEMSFIESLLARGQATPNLPAEFQDQIKALSTDYETGKKYFENHPHCGPWEKKLLVDLSNLYQNLPPLPSDKAQAVQVYAASLREMQTIMEHRLRITDPGSNFPLQAKISAAGNFESFQVTWLGWDYLNECLELE